MSTVPKPSNPVPSLTADSKENTKFNPKFCSKNRPKAAKIIGKFVFRLLRIHIPSEENTTRAEGT